ncbi:MAG: CoB--CoM heterodisulfide reductase iron-sulfur subunit A family protein, partial [Spirochaetales bacterium]|nr:CoB--CoM heterodisulfide reductase iron-sulfur subunit A family protein [Spirochaetales bacterium]
MSKFLIVGSGVSGCAAGLELARLGNDVQIIERESRFGGKVLDYCCKATDGCSRCGVCVAVSGLRDALRQPKLHVTVGARIREVRRGSKVSARVVRSNPAIDYGKCLSCDACVAACPEGCIERLGKGELVQYAVDFERCRLHRGVPCSACADACPAGAITAGEPASELSFAADGVLVATGHQVYDASRKVRFGYGRLEGVLTGEEAESILSRQMSLGPDAKRVAFIQCVGSRDPEDGRNYCSAVCCAYALRLARLLKYRSPQTQITVFYIDLQSFDKSFTTLRGELQSLGVELVRGVPFRVERMASGALQLMVENPEGDHTILEYDRVILSVGMEPDGEAEDVAGQFGLSRNEFGFFLPSAESAGG